MHIWNAKEVLKKGYPNAIVTVALAEELDFGELFRLELVLALNNYRIGREKKWLLVWR